LLRPLTTTGVSAVFVVPSPSWPAPLSPQQRTVLSTSSAQVKNDPAVSATAPLTPLTATGVSVGVVVPSPS
jgi:hypothetical protein